MTADVAPEVLDHVCALERELQTSACRADEARVRTLLAADFVEVGASGRRWDLDSTLELLRAEQGGSTTADIEVLDLVARAIAPGVVQVSWDSDRGGRRARRTSIWCEREVGWQQVFHQGTLLG